MAFDLLARLKIDDQMSAGLRKVAGESSRVSKALDETTGAATRMRRITESAGGAFSRMGNAGKSALGGISGAAKGVLGAVTSLRGAIVASGAAYAGIIAPLKLANDAEQANIAFTTMLGSAAKAKTFLSDLSNFANKTPFELPALRDSSKRLLAFGFASKQIIPMMTGIGNAASGLGLGADGIDRITLALGQMKAKGRLQGDEAMALTEAGIPVWDILAKKMKLTTAQVIKLSEKGLIPADKAINVLVKGMNDKFPNMMDKQSKSLGGLYSTIKDTFNSKILTKWGEGIATGIKPQLDRLVSWINNNGPTIDRWSKNLQSAATQATDWVVSKFRQTFTWLKTNLFDDPKWASSTLSEKLAMSATTIGSKLGSMLMSSVASAAKSAITNHPLLSALFGGLLLGKTVGKLGEIKMTMDSLTGKGGIGTCCCCTGGTGTAAGGTGKKATAAAVLPEIATFAAAATAFGIGITAWSSAWEDVKNDKRSIYSSPAMAGVTPPKPMSQSEYMFGQSASPSTPNPAYNPSILNGWRDGGNGPSTVNLTIHNNNTVNNQSDADYLMGQMADQLAVMAAHNFGQ